MGRVTGSDVGRVAVGRVNEGNVGRVAVGRVAGDNVGRVAGGDVGRGAGDVKEGDIKKHKTSG